MTHQPDEDHDQQPISSARRKVRRACTPCKTRKRKCDGHFPCSTCLRWEYDCDYSQPTGLPAAKARKTASPPGPNVGTARPPTVAAENDHMQLSPTQANSGVALSQAIANQHAVVKSNVMLGWNVGLKPLATPDQLDPTDYPCAVGTLITQHDLLACMATFFSSMGLLYPIIGRDTMTVLIQQRFRAANPYQVIYPLDALLSVFAAISLTYSSTEEQTRSSLSQLSENAKRCLDCCADDDPSDMYVVALALRTLLLRSSGPPHACWISSCMLVSCLEAQRLQTAQMLPATGPVLPQSETNALYWTSKLLHMWICFELGRPLAVTPDQADIPANTVSKYPSSVLSLFGCSSRLSPFKDSTADQFEAAFSELEAFDCTGNDALGLSRCICAMTVFRRRYIQAPPVSALLKARVIDIGRGGLGLVKALLEQPGPWWHLINLPLQFLCLLLVLDNTSDIPAALETLRQVALVYPTDRVQSTVSFAENIVRAVQQRKQKESRMLIESLGSAAPNINGATPSSADFDVAMASNANGLDGSFTGQLLNMDELDWDMFPNSGALAFDGIAFN